MRKLFALAAVVLCSYVSYGQGGYPSTDSLHRYVNKYIKYEVLPAFQQLRLNTALHGIINWIDSARLGTGGSVGMDTLYKINDSTLRYKKNGLTFTLPFKGVADNRRKVDSIFKTNDTTLTFSINGNVSSVSVGGGDATTAYVDSLFNAIPPGIVSVGYGFDGTGTFADPYIVDTLPQNNGLITTHRLSFITDSIIDLITGGGGLSSVTHDITLTGAGTVPSPLKVDTAKIATISYVDNKPGISPPNGSETKVINGVGYTVSGTGTTADPYILTITGSSGDNPFKAISIEQYGGIADAVAPVSGNNATGTNNTPFLQSAINAAADGQLIIIPNGKWLFSTPLDTIKGPKRVNILILGDTYHNGSDFLIFMNAGGAVERHSVQHYGLCIGRFNMPSQTQATHDAGTQPAWSTFTGTPFKIYNTAQIRIEFNRIEGFKNGIELIGYDYDGATRGVQEISVSGGWLFKNANGITLTSINGRSFINQCTFTGNNHGPLRITGGLALKIDGYSGVAYNGETYNGAFRNNEFHFMSEGVDSIAEVWGDVSENLFHITVEQGTYGAVGYRMLSTGPNYVRGAIFEGNGILNIARIQNGLGLNGEIRMPIWDVFNGRFYGNYGTIDGSGNIVVSGSNLTKTQRDAAPAIFRFSSSGYSEVFKSITSATYTAAPGEVIVYNHATGVGTNPSASTYIGKRITWVNVHATNALAITNAVQVTSIPAGNSITYLSNGTSWYPTNYLPGTGGGGSGIFTADANGYNTSSKVGFGIASVTSAFAVFGGSTTSLGSFKITAGTNHPTAPADGVVWRMNNQLYIAQNSIVQQILTVPDNGQAGQIVRRNAANDGYEHAYYSRMEYSNTSTIVSSGASSSAKISLFGGTQSLDPLNSGDEIIIEGAGTIATAFSGTSQPTFDFVMNASTVTFNTAALAANKFYNYKIRIRVVAGGNYDIDLKISEGSNSTSLPPVYCWNIGSASGLNLAAPTINLRSWFTNASQLLNAEVSTIKIERK